MKKTTISALSLLVAFTATSAFAADSPIPPAGGPGGKPPIQIRDDRDTNKDGVISKEEWTARSDKAFTEIDANKDGKITQEEQKAHYEAKRAEMEKRRAEFGTPPGKPIDAAKPVDAPKPVEKK
ncbi:MAG: hypothetical protein K2X09_01585 [Rickettsiales bacterium]|nr:hypothetical protein [Rickettsiales bacterium]